MKLVDMKCSDEKNKMGSVMVSEQEYPYGLCIHLDEESIAKLGIKLPEVGSEMMLMAKVEVTMVSSQESKQGEYRSMSLQIEEMSLGAVKKEKDAGEVLYG